MPVDQLPETKAVKPVEPVDTGSTAEGRNKTLLFAGIIGAVILVGAIGRPGDMGRGRRRRQSAAADKLPWT